MRYKSLIGKEEERDVLKSEDEASDKYGIIGLSKRHLFFRKFLKTYYIAYEDLNAVFRRVYMVSGRKNAIPAETLVLVSYGTEIASIGVSGTKSAKEILEKIKEKAPHIDTKFKVDAAEITLHLLLLLRQILTLTTSNTFLLNPPRFRRWTLTNMFFLLRKKT